MTSHSGSLAMSSSDDGVETMTWLRKLPKVELHLHLEGTVTPTTLVTLSRRHDEVPLTRDDVVALYEYTDFMHFLTTFRNVVERLQTPEDWALITREMIKDLAAQGVVHAEVYMGWGTALRVRPDVDFNSIMAAVDTARVQAEKEFGVSIRWIIDLNRHRGVEECGRVLDAVLWCKEVYPSIIGIGIGGDEANGPCAWFKDLYARAKASGLRLVAHAGESTGPVQGPKNIRDALDIGAERIGHGTCAVYDEQLMEVLKQKQTPIEVSVTSNLKTGVCPSLQQHPIRQYLEKGLMVTINSDDPAMFGSNLLEEYALVQQLFGLSYVQMCALAQNSVTASFLPEERKAEISTSIHIYQASTLGTKSV